MVHIIKMAEKKTVNVALRKIGNLLESKRLALGDEYKSRERFIINRSDELFGSEDWLSLRHLHNIEKGKNWISVEKLIILSEALEIDPTELFSEIVEIYKESQKST